MPVALAVVLVAAVVVVGVVRGSGGGEPVEVAPATEQVTDAGTTFGRHEALPGAPALGRSGAVSVWTGDEWLLWGGAEPDGSTDGFTLLADGLAFDPGADRWRELPEAPLDARHGAAAVWSDDRLVVWGGVDLEGEVFDDGAAYLPAGDRWEPLPPAPLPARFGAVAMWTGEAVVVAGGVATVPTPEAPQPRVAREVAAVDLAEGAWRELAPLPEDAVAARVELVATDAGVLAWQREYGWLYRPGADRWERTPPLPADARAREGSRPVPLGGEEVLVIGARPVADQRVLGMLLDLDEGWGEAVGPGLAPSEVGYVHTVGGGDGTLVLLPDGPPSFARDSVRPALWDIELDRWLPIPRAVVHDRAAYMSAWTGEELLVWGGLVSEGIDPGEATAYRDDGVRWRLTDP